MRILAALSLFLLLAGCRSNQNQPSSQVAESGDALAAHDAAGGTAPAEAKDPLKGKILEKMDAAGYSYLRLATDGGEIWAAVVQTDAKVGDNVAVVDPMPMKDFKSSTLKRTFDVIMFGSLQDSGGGDSKQMMMNVHAGVGSASTSSEPIKVDRAAGPDGRTVAEVYAQRLDLKGRKVAVHGKVVKVNPNIMGKNWIHVQDGTGDSPGKTNDLTVTSQAYPSVGDTVLIEGVVLTDKSYGMGYDFPVIIEDAAVQTQ